MKVPLCTQNNLCLLSQWEAITAPPHRDHCFRLVQVHPPTAGNVSESGKVSGCQSRKQQVFTGEAGIHQACLIHEYSRVKLITIRILSSHPLHPNNDFPVSLVVVENC